MGKNLKKTDSFFVVGDLHTHIETAESILAQNPARVIWLGDWLDRHGEVDGPYECVKVAQFLRKIMVDRPQDVFIMGNHELAYRFPEAEKYAICGSTRAKVTAFNEYFPEKLWDRFKIAHVEEWNSQKLVFSHAGLTPTFFPLGKFDEDHLTRIAKIAIDHGHRSDYNPLFDHDSAGPMWMRWQTFPLFEGICQIVGHTCFACPQIRAVSTGPEWNLGLDCAHTYYAVFKDKHAFAIDRHKGYEKLLNFTAPKTPKYELDCRE